ISASALRLTRIQARFGGFDPSRTRVSGRVFVGQPFQAVRRGDRQWRGPKAITRGGQPGKAVLRKIYPDLQRARDGEHFGGVSHGWLTTGGAGDITCRMKRIWGTQIRAEKTKAGDGIPLFVLPRFARRVRIPSHAKDLRGLWYL